MPYAGALPSPVSTWPRTPRGSRLPYMYCARRSIVAPASTFSLAASSRKRSGATMRTFCFAISSTGITPSIAAEVVEVAVREDHRADRLRAERLLDQSPRGGGGLLRRERVDDDPAGLPLDDRHVRDVVAAHLMDAARHLEQAVQIVEPSLAPQARVHARGRLAVQERVGGRVPDARAVRALDDEAVLVRDEAALRVGHVGGVVERQRRERVVRRARGGAGGRGARGVGSGVAGRGRRRRVGARDAASAAASAIGRSTERIISSGRACGSSACACP